MMTPEQTLNPNSHDTAASAFQALRFAAVEATGRYQVPDEIDATMLRLVAPGEGDAVPSVPEILECLWGVQQRRTLLDLVTVILAGDYGDIDYLDSLEGYLAQHRQTFAACEPEDLPASRWLVDTAQPLVDRYRELLTTEGAA